MRLGQICTRFVQKLSRIVRIFDFRFFCGVMLVSHVSHLCRQVRTLNIHLILTATLLARVLARLRCQKMDQRICIKFCVKK